MIHEFDVLFRAKVPKNKQIIHKLFARESDVFTITFRAAADGSSGSLRNGFAFSVFKLIQCRVLTSPILKSVGASNENKIVINKYFMVLLV